MGWEQAEQGYLGGGGPGLGWMSPERRRDRMKGLEKGGPPWEKHKQLDVGLLEQFGLPPPPPPPPPMLLGDRTTV